MNLQEAIVEAYRIGAVGIVRTSVTRKEKDVSAAIYLESICKIGVCRWGKQTQKYMWEPTKDDLLANDWCPLTIGTSTNRGLSIQEAIMQAGAGGKIAREEWGGGHCVEPTNSYEKTLLHMTHDERRISRAWNPKVEDLIKKDWKVADIEVLEE